MKMVGLALVASLAAAQPAAAGLFARHAISVSGVFGSPRPMTVTAPDGHTRAIARFTDWTPDDSDDHLSIFIGGDDHKFPGGPNAELLWSPDSRALAVTANDGGATGDFEATLLVRKPKGRHWREINLTPTVTQLFKSRMRCDDDEQPNVGAVGWTSEKRLIVAAQVPPHSSCSNMGMTAAYVIDVQTGDALMDVDAQTLHQRYRHMLGTVFSSGKHRKHHRRTRR